MERHSDAPLVTASAKPEPSPYRIYRFISGPMDEMTVTHERGKSYMLTRSHCDRHQVGTYEPVANFLVWMGWD